MLEEILKVRGKE